MSSLSTLNIVENRNYLCYNESAADANLISPAAFAETSGSPTGVFGCSLYLVSEEERDHEQNVLF
jgi:hypothetical protein